MLVLGCWSLDVGPWMLVLGCWSLDVGPWMLDVPHRTSDNSFTILLPAPDTFVFRSGQSSSYESSIAHCNRRDVNRLRFRRRTRAIPDCPRSKSPLFTRRR